MNGWDWSPYADPAMMQGVDPTFATALAALFQAAPEDIRGNLRINSGYRSVEHQQRLWDDALQKYGSPEAARKWVAPPGNSRHNHGLAVDLGYVNDAAREWVHANAATHGLHFPMSWENWHIEPVGANGGRAAIATGPRAVDPTSPAGMQALGDLLPLQMGAPVGIGLGDMLAGGNRRREEKQKRDAAEQQNRIGLASLIV